jgi:hypothetical protein
MVPEGVPESPGYIANGISFLIVLANEPTNIFVPSRAHVFSPSSDAEIDVNGLTLTVPRGSHKEIPSGSVRIIANATVVVEVISDVYYHIDQSSLRQRAGIMNFAAHLLPAAQLEITYPPPKPTEGGPSSADEFNILLVGVAVVLVAAAAFLVVRRRSQTAI